MHFALILKEYRGHYGWVWDQNMLAYTARSSVAHTEECLRNCEGREDAIESFLQQVNRTRRPPLPVKVLTTLLKRTPRFALPKFTCFYGFSRRLDQTGASWSLMSLFPQILSNPWATYLYVVYHREYNLPFDTLYISQQGYMWCLLTFQNG